MLVQEIMTKEVVTIDSNDTIFDAFIKYRDEKVGCMIVTDKERCVGIVTERDLIEKAVCLCKDPKKTKIKEIMSSDIKTIHPFEKIETAVEIMEKYRIKKLPVVSDNDKLVGIITITDIALAVPELTGRVERFIQSWVCPSWEE
jgi:CBS domain-containing protein